MIVHFVDIGGIDDYHCLSFPFIKIYVIVEMMKKKVHMARSHVFID
jgi:hypothetical protein